MTSDFQCVFLFALRMALPTRVVRRTKAIHGRRDRTMIRIRREPDQLPDTRDFVMDKCLGAPTDMTVDAWYCGMTRVLIPHVLRLHCRMTCFPAKLLRIHYGNAVICSRSQDARIRQRRKCDRPAEPCKLRPLARQGNEFPITAVPARRNSESQWHQ